MKRRIVTCKLTAKCQATIPERIRGVLDLHPGDSVAFEVTGDEKVVLCKATTIDLEFAKALENPWPRSGFPRTTRRPMPLFDRESQRILRCSAGRSDWGGQDHVRSQ